MCGVDKVKYPTTSNPFMSKPADLGSLKIGSYILLPVSDQPTGEPCRISEYDTSKPGKHGAAKARIVGVGIFDGQKRPHVGPVSMQIHVPLIDKRIGQIIKFEGCYHGAHDSVLVKAGSGSAHAGISTSDGDLKDSTKNTLVVQYNNLEDLYSVVSKHKNDLAIIVEPILANMGLILPKRKFLRELRRITKEYSVPLIFDETVTGFRISPGGAQEYFGIKPDITTLGKALGGGFAIAAIGGKRQIMEQLAPSGRVYQASTFAGNPIAVSAALASLKVMHKLGRRMHIELERRCAHLVSAIDDAADESHVPHQIILQHPCFRYFLQASQLLIAAKNQMSNSASVFAACSSDATCSV